MPDSIRSFAVEVLEYGKFFSNKDTSTSDFLVLAYTRSMQNERRQFQDILSFPLNSVFIQQVGAVSAAFLPATPKDHVFVQVQQRVENEIVRNGSRGRQYQQERYTLVPNNLLKELLSEHVQIYQTLIFNHPRNRTPGCPELKNYLEHIDGKIEKQVIDFPEDDDQAYIDAWGLQIKLVTEKVLHSEARGRHVRVICPGWELADKARLMDIVQRLIFPLLGIISFALDYVSEPYYPIRVLFLNDPAEQIAPRDAVDVADFRRSDYEVDKDSYASRIIQLRKNYSWEVIYNLLADKYVIMALQNIFAGRVDAEYATIFDGVDDFLKGDAHRIIAYCQLKEQIVSYPSFSSSEFYSDINDMYALLDDVHKKMVMRAVHQCVLEARNSHTDFYTQVCDQALAPIDKLTKLDFNMLVRGMREKWDGKMPHELRDIFVKNAPFYGELFEYGRGDQTILDNWPDEKVHHFFLKLFDELLLLPPDQFKLAIKLVGRFFELDYFASKLLLDDVWSTSFSRYFPNLLRHKKLLVGMTFGSILSQDVARVESFAPFALARDVRWACILRARVKRKWPIPVIDLAFLIDQVAQENIDCVILDEIPTIDGQPYDELSPIHWLRWVHAIRKNHPEPDAVWWAFYERAKKAHPVSVKKHIVSLSQEIISFFEKMLCWILRHPNHNKQLGEYEFWVNCLKRYEASELPDHLRILTGERIEGKSIGWATNSICTLHQERLLRLAIKYLVGCGYTDFVTTSDVLRLVK